MNSADQALQARSEAESPVLHRVEVEVGPEQVQRAFDRAYRELAKSARVRGFRPGKVPRAVLERLYATSVAESLEQRLVSETLGDALERCGLEPVAEPSIEAGPPRAGEAFRYTARIEVKPPIELPELAGLPGRRPSSELGEAEVLTELENLRQRHAVLREEPEGTAAEHGSVLTLDYLGRVEGQPFEGGSGQGVEVELGSGQLLPGFEEQLEGSVAGEDRQVRVRFPDDTQNAELAGREAEFAVHVVAVKRRELPELDDEFAKDLGEFGTLTELRDRVRADLVAARERNARAELHRSLLDALIARVSFELPAGMVERQLQRRLANAHRQLEEQVPHDALHQQLARWREEWRPAAERQVRETLLLEAVARQEALEVSAEEIEARVHEMAAAEGVDAARLRSSLGGEALEDALRLALRDEKALELLAGQAKVEEATDT